MKQLLQPLINGFYRILEVILVINMIIMFVLVFMNVVLRLGFNTGIDFAEEVPRFAFIWMTFVGAVIGMRKHTHLGVDMVVAVLPLLGRKACWATSQIIMTVCSLYMLYGTWLQHDILQNNTSAVLQISMLWVYGVSYVTGVAIALICLSNLIRLARGEVSDDELIDVHEEGLTEGLEAERDMKAQGTRP